MESSTDEDCDDEAFGEAEAEARPIASGPLTEAQAAGKSSSSPKAKKPKKQTKTETREEEVAREMALPWFKRKGWRQWWTFCRSLGHKDFTISTL